jgi:tRNA threonylcarbamoyl adenosine modification protein YjeE
MIARAMVMAGDSFFVQLVLKSEPETVALGAQIAELLRPGDLVGLAGNLGAGKTTLARALVRHLLPGEEVPSPTFTLVQIYDVRQFKIWHTDLYRVKARSELRELGFEEALEDGVLLVEWPDRMGEDLPEDRLDVIMEVDDGAEDRRVKLIGRGSWASRVKFLAGAP